MNTPWLVWKNLCHFSAFFPVLNDWCSVSGGITLEQVTKPILFSVAYEGLQDCMPCWSYVSRSSCTFIA